MTRSTGAGPPVPPHRRVRRSLHGRPGGVSSPCRLSRREARRGTASRVHRDARGGAARRVAAAARGLLRDLRRRVRRHRGRRGSGEMQRRRAPCGPWSRSPPARGGGVGVGGDRVRQLRAHVRTQAIADRRPAGLRGGDGSRRIPHVQSPVRPAREYDARGRRFSRAYCATRTAPGGAAAAARLQRPPSGDPLRTSWTGGARRPRDASSGRRWRRPAAKGGGGVRRRSGAPGSASLCGSRACRERRQSGSLVPSKDGSDEDAVRSRRAEVEVRRFGQTGERRPTC